VVDSFLLLFILLYLYVSAYWSFVYGAAPWFPVEAQSYCYSCAVVPDCVAGNIAVDNKFRELNAVKLLHNILLNITVVAF
jgi:hypothetical protein